MSYTIILTEQAEQDLEKLEKSEPSAYRKAISLIENISETPTTGIGKPEQLKGYENSNVYSRRITQKHRLVYQIKSEEIIVIIISAYGHYDDK